MGGHLQRTPPTRNYPKGGWEARWRVVDEAGRRRTRARTFARRRDAERFLAEVQVEIDRGEHIDPRLARTPYGQLAADWLATNPGAKPRTRTSYESLLRTHVGPYFGAMEVGRINKATVRQFIAAMENKGAAPGTTRNAIRNVLKPSLDLAVEVGMIKANPAAGIRLPQSPKAEMLFLTAEQVRLLASAIAPPYDTLVLFAAYTGLRAGEIGALRRDNLDLLRMRLTVAASVAEVPGQGLVYGPTKTYALRTVSMPQFLREPLVSLIDPLDDDPTSLVFHSPDGGPLRHGNFYRRVFKPAVRAALPSHLHGLRFHDLRHTCASMLINPPINANPKAVQLRLGHSSIQVTFDRYGHLYPGVDEQLGVDLNNLAIRGSSAQEDAPLSADLRTGS